MFANRLLTFDLILLCKCFDRLIQFRRTFISFIKRSEEIVALVFDILKNWMLIFLFQLDLIILLICIFSLFNRWYGPLFYSTLILKHRPTPVTRRRDNIVEIRLSSLHLRGCSCMSFDCYLLGHVGLWIATSWGSLRNIVLSKHSSSIWLRFPLLANRLIWPLLKQSRHD